MKKAELTLNEYVGYSYILTEFFTGNIYMDYDINDIKLILFENKDQICENYGWQLLDIESTAAMIQLLGEYQYRFSVFDEVLACTNTLNIKLSTIVDLYRDTVETAEKSFYEKIQKL